MDSCQHALTGLTGQRQHRSEDSAWRLGCPPQPMREEHWVNQRLAAARNPDKVSQRIVSQRGARTSRDDVRWLSRCLRYSGEPPWTEAHRGQAWLFTLRDRKWLGGSRLGSTNPVGSKEALISGSCFFETFFDQQAEFTRLAELAA